MKPEFAVITDTHLEDGNEELTFAIHKETRERCQILGLEYCYHGGDVFHNRKHQTQSTLHTYDRVLMDAEENNFKWRVIPGNHDKADYKSSKSYLDVYRKFESLELVTAWDVFDEGPFAVHLIPFFDEKHAYKPLFDTVRFEKGKRHILITHAAINGVMNNDGSKVSEALSAGMFGDFERVLVGHYHDRQEIGNNIVYIGSTHQHNFGEDGFKGITFMYADGSMEQVALDCVPKYTTVKVDLDEMTDQEIDQIVSDNSNTDENTRIKFVGRKDKLEKIDRKKLREGGIDVKFEEAQIDVDLSYVGKSDFRAFKTDDIVTNWDTFCKHKEVDEETQTLGLNILKKQLSDG